MADTKICPSCDTEIGVNEDKCPKCGFDIDDETLTNFEKCLKITEKRRESERKKKEAENPPTPPIQKKKRFFDSLKGRK